MQRNAKQRSKIQFYTTRGNAMQKQRANKLLRAQQLRFFSFSAHLSAAQQTFDWRTRWQGAFGKTKEAKRAQERQTENETKTTET